MAVKHNLIYLLITIKLATCFDPIGSSSDLYYETINVKRLRTSLGSQQCLQKINIKGSCPIGHETFIFRVRVQLDTKLLYFVFVSNWTRNFYISCSCPIGHETFIFRVNVQLDTKLLYFVFVSNWTPNFYVYLL